MGRLDGKVCIVTGAASDPGLGRTTALTLAREGAKVVVTDVTRDGINATAAAIEAAGGQALALHQDVTDEARWGEIIDETISRFGGFDVLVNNAGIAVLKPLGELTLDDWNKQLNVNLTSVFLGCRTAVPVLGEQGGGSIINLSSVAGLVGLSRCVAYGAAKGGVRLLTKSVAMEAAKDNVRCNSVHPGFIWTNMQSKATGANEPDSVPISDMVPLGRVGEPEDIANCILYLASDESSYVTGAELTVDAGMTAR